MPIEIRKKELKLLRNEVLRKYLSEVDNLEIREGEEFRDLGIEESLQKFEDIKIKTTLKGYEKLLDFINESLTEKFQNTFQESTLRKLFYYSKDKESQKYQEFVLDALYMFISDNELDRIKYYEVYPLRGKQPESTVRPLESKKNAEIALHRERPMYSFAVLVGIVIILSNVATLLITRTFFPSEKVNTMKELEGKWYYDVHPSSEVLGYGSPHYGGEANFQIEDNTFGQNLSITGALSWKYVGDILVRVPPTEGWKTISGSITANDKMIYQYQAFDYGRSISGFCSFNIVRNKEGKITELSGEFYRVDTPYVKGSIYMRRASPFYEEPE